MVLVTCLSLMLLIIGVSKVRVLRVLACRVPAEEHQGVGGAGICPQLQGQQDGEVEPHPV